MAKHKSVKTTEHFEWDEDAQDWKPTHKTVEDHEENDEENDEDGGQPYRLMPSPWNNPPYRAHWHDLPSYPHITCDSANDNKYGVTGLDPNKFTLLYLKD